VFSPFPGFESLPIEVEIHSQGRARIVVARVEQLPTSPPRATLVLSFPDAPEDGEWLLCNGERDIYTLGNPAHLLRFHTVYHPHSRELEEWAELSPRRVEKVRSLIERALGETRKGLRVVRAVELPDLPHAPRIALLWPSKGIWFENRQPQHDQITPFVAPGFDFWSQGASAPAWLQWQLNDPDSDARFAWQWASWSEKERVWRSCGSQFDAREVQQVMKWVLFGADALWRRAANWEWALQPDYASYGWLRSWPERDVGLDTHLSVWQEWLFAFLAPAWRADWLEHLCVREFWGQRNLVEVVLEVVPTMHERLEARLELRAWLQGKATPDEVERLISI